MRKIFLQLLKIYQKISLYTPKSCRYYPTCSQYSRWLFEKDALPLAFFKSCKRVLTCNQLFSGGIDYPVIDFTPPKPTRVYNLPQNEKFNKNRCKLRIVFWLVPKNKKKFYLIKDFDESATYLPARYAPALAPRCNAKKSSSI